MPCLATQCRKGTSMHVWKHSEGPRRSRRPAVHQHPSHCQGICRLLERRVANEGQGQHASPSGGWCVWPARCLDAASAIMSTSNRCTTMPMLWLHHAHGHTALSASALLTVGALYDMQSSVIYSTITLESPALHPSLDATPPLPTLRWRTIAGTGQTNSHAM